MLAANVILGTACVYLALGIGFGIAFAACGAARLDSAAKGASIGFRIVIFPGSVVLWPILLLKWIRS